MAKLIVDWKLSLGFDIGDELEDIKEIFLYRCQAGRVDFLGRPEAAGTVNFYENQRKFDWYYMADEWEFADAVRDLFICQLDLEARYDSDSSNLGIVPASKKGEAEAGRSELYQQLIDWTDRYWDSMPTGHSKSRVDFSACAKGR